MPWPGLGRWLQGEIGFTMEERMHGTHRFLRDFSPGEVRAGTELPLALVARWGHPRAARYLNPLGGDFMRADLEGEISAGGLCEAAPVKGELELRYLKDSTVRYRFEFAAAGRRWRYEGEKSGIRPWNLHRTHTTCRGRIVEIVAAPPALGLPREGEGVVEEGANGRSRAPDSGRSCRDQQLDGEPLSESVVYFDLAQLPRFLASLRLR